MFSKIQLIFLILAYFVNCAIYSKRCWIRSFSHSRSHQATAFLKKALSYRTRSKDKQRCITLHFDGWDNTELASSQKIILQTLYCDIMLFAHIGHTRARIRVMLTWITHECFTIQIRTQHHLAHGYYHCWGSASRVVRFTAVHCVLIELHIPV